MTKDLADKCLEDDEKLKSQRKLISAGRTASSPKLQALLDEWRAMQAKDKNVKAIVFSQWTSFLDIVEATLEKENIRFERLDGGMTEKKRRDAIDRFQSISHIRIFLISLKAGGLGLNLTAASKVFMLDPWWNPSAEDQAIDRVHRLGQEHDVEIVKFICKNTVEERIVSLQDRKRLMLQTALVDDRSRKELQADRLQELAELFK
jgi:SNF2 family DNA or RNA helicase